LANPGWIAACGLARNDCHRQLHFLGIHSPAAALALTTLGQHLDDTSGRMGSSDRVLDYARHPNGDPAVDRPLPLQEVRGS